MPQQSGGDDKGNFEKIGEGLGGLVGQAADSVSGMFGGMLRDMGGWWAENTRPPGSGTVSASFGTERDGECRRHFTARGSAESRPRDYEQARPLYELGHLAGQNPEYRGRSFDQVEMDLQRGWGESQQRQHGAWPEVRGFVEFGYEGASPSGSDRSASRSAEATGGFQASGKTGGGFSASGGATTDSGRTEGGLHASGTTPGGSRAGLDVEAGASRDASRFNASGGSAESGGTSGDASGRDRAAGNLHVSGSTPGGTRGELDVKASGNSDEDRTSGGFRASGEVRRED